MHAIDGMSGSGRGAEARSRGAGTARDRAILVAVRAHARTVDILGVTEQSSCSAIVKYSIFASMLCVINGGLHFTGILD